MAHACSWTLICGRWAKFTTPPTHHHHPQTPNPPAPKHQVWEASLSLLIKSVFISIWHPLLNKFLQYLRCRNALKPDWSPFFSVIHPTGGKKSRSVRQRLIDRSPARELRLVDPHCSQGVNIKAGVSSNRTSKSTKMLQIAAVMARLTDVSHSNLIGPTFMTWNSNSSFLFEVSNRRIDFLQTSKEKSSLPAATEVISVTAGERET